MTGLAEAKTKLEQELTKIEKVINEEEAFRRKTAFHAYAGSGSRSFSEIEMQAFKLYAEKLHWLLAVLAGLEKTYVCVEKKQLREKLALLRKEYYQSTKQGGDNDISARMDMLNQLLQYIIYLST